MTEPIYSYVKGQGWITNHQEPHDALIRVVRGEAQYDVFIYKRAPKIGERGFWISSSEFRNAEIIVPYWNQGEAGWESHNDYSQFKNDGPDYLVTAVTVKV